MCHRARSSRLLSRTSVPRAMTWWSVPPGARTTSWWSLPTTRTPSTSPWAGYQTLPNVGHFDGATEDGRYLDGLVAGSQPGVELVGYVGGFAIEEVVRGINAFMIGARELNPDIQVQAVWVNSWYDPAPSSRQPRRSWTPGPTSSPARSMPPRWPASPKRPASATSTTGSTVRGWRPTNWLSSFTSTGVPTTCPRRRRWPTARGNRP